MPDSEAEHRTMNGVAMHAKRLSRGMLAGLIIVLGSVVPAPGGAGAPGPDTLSISPAAGPWFTDVSIGGMGCVGPPDTEVVVVGRLYRLDEQMSGIGQFRAFPAADGTWSASYVVVHQSWAGPLTPGSYEFRARCGIATTDELGNTVPSEPPLLTSTGAFDVLPGGPTPVLAAEPTTVTIVDGRADVVASGDLCARPDGPSSGQVQLWGPIGGDPDDPTTIYVAGGSITPDADGLWSSALVPGVTATGPMTPKPGSYSLTAICWLGTEGFETSNGFEYTPLTVTLVEEAPPAPPAPRAAPTFTG